MVVEENTGQVKSSDWDALLLRSEKLVQQVRDGIESNERTDERTEPETDPMEFVFGCTGFAHRTRSVASLAPSHAAYLPLVTRHTDRMPSCRACSGISTR